MIWQLITSGRDKFYNVKYKLIIFSALPNDLMPVAIHSSNEVTQATINFQVKIQIDNN